jgi:integrase/recombinase XerD
MNDVESLGPWVRRFLVEHLLTRRNLARTTQLTYRDTLAMVIRYAVAATGRRADLLRVEDISRELVTKCLAYREHESGCTPRTSNRHLAALHTFARFVGEYSPEHVQWAGNILSMPLKKFARPQLPYLEKMEMDALLAAPAICTSQGRRDHALLLFLYNTGARASEVAQLRVADLQIHEPDKGKAFVTLHGKGQRTRSCPLWPHTARELRPLVVGRPDDHSAFLNRRREPLTRFGIHAIVERYARRAAQQAPTLAAKRVSPHTIRHTTATHLLRSGVDINTIRAWLGHMSLSTTNVYTEIDLEMKSRALAHLDSVGQRPRPRRITPSLMQFLSTL